MRTAGGSAASVCAVFHISLLANSADTRCGLFLISYGDFSGNARVVHGL